MLGSLFSWDGGAFAVLTSRICLTFRFRRCITWRARMGAILELWYTNDEILLPDPDCHAHDGLHGAK